MCWGHYILIWKGVYKVKTLQNNMYSVIPFFILKYMYTHTTQKARPPRMYISYQWSWALKNWCFWTVVLAKILESLLDCKEIQPVHPKGDQSWVFIGRTDVEAETPILGPPDAKNWLIWKDPDAGKDWGQEEKGTTEDEMVGWHHWLDGHGFWWTPGVGDGQGGLACCRPWGCKESDTTELNWTDLWVLRFEVFFLFVYIFLCTTFFFFFNLSFDCAMWLP